MAGAIGAIAIEKGLDFWKEGIDGVGFYKKSSGTKTYGLDRFIYARERGHDHDFCLSLTSQFFDFCQGVDWSEPHIKQYEIDRALLEKIFGREFTEWDGIKSNAAKCGGVNDSCFLGVVDYKCRSAVSD
jgi:hypothetical protein